MSTPIMVFSLTVAIACLGYQAQPANTDAVGQVADTQPAPLDGSADIDDLPVLDTPDPAQPAGRIEEGEPVPIDRLLWHIPDPQEFRESALQRVEEAQKQIRELTAQRAEAEKRKATDAEISKLNGELADARAQKDYYERLAIHLDAVWRPRQLSVPLTDVLHRTLAHSYAVRIEGYNPAVRQTQVVEAEAAFDAVFYTTMNKSIQNVPVASRIQGSNIDTFLLEGGLRQLLPTGMQVSTSLNLNRTMNDFAFQLINPAYESQFTVEFRQPFLRGFGLDYNRSQINIAKNDRRISDHEFVRRVQETLLNVETAYWRLFQARRIATIQARLLTTFEQLYERLKQREKFDVIPIQVNETKARLEAARADFIRIVNEIRNAEDGLISLVNDPAFDLADDIELIPADMPTLEALVVDRLAEVQSALDHRQEIAQAKLRINSARILVGAAKNQVLPQLDLLGSYSVDGLGESADDAFDEVTKNDFHEYFVGIEFELPVGNRARRAQEWRARLQHGQAIATLKQTFEQVIFDVNVRVREVMTQFNLIGPGFESSEASEQQVESLRARAERQDFVQLSNELSAIQQLAANRSDLLQALVEYNIALVELERAKGTLLDYYNVTVPTADGTGE